MTRMKRQGGYSMIVNAGDTGQTVERDTYTCRHCNRIVAVRPMCDPMELGRRCGACDGLLCRRCSGLDGCTHIEVRLEAIERRAALIKSMTG